MATGQHRYVMAATKLHIHAIPSSAAIQLFLSKSRVAVTTMAIPAEALDEAEGCDGLTCKDDHGYDIRQMQCGGQPCTNLT